MCIIFLEYGLSPTIPRSLQHILSHQPKLTKGIFHDYLTKRQLPEVGLLNPLLQVAAGIGFIRNVPPRLRNRQRFGSTTIKQPRLFISRLFFCIYTNLINL